METETAQKQRKAQTVSACQAQGGRAWLPTERLFCSLQDQTMCSNRGLHHRMVAHHQDAPETSCCV